MKRIFYALLTLSMLALACNLSGALQSEPQVDLELVLTATSLALVLQGSAIPPTQAIQPPMDTSNPTETTQPSATTCVPTVTATLEVNVCKGPDAVFERVGFLRVGESAKVAGRESSGNWWYIEFPAGSGGFAWVWAEAVTPSCIPTDLQVVDTPPTPTPSTPKADIKIIEIFVDSAWKPLLKLANAGPNDLQNAKTDLTCAYVFTPNVGGEKADAFTMQIPLTLAVGNELTDYAGLAALTDDGKYVISCTISPVGFEDPDPGNNSKSITINKGPFIPAPN
jgi:hypothetical protein